MLHGVASFVWQDAPGADADAVSTWLVKAANGNGTIGNGHDYAASYAAWADAVGPHRTHAWTWLYDTTDGARAAEVLVASAPDALGYGMDVEGDDTEDGRPVDPELDRQRLGPVVRAFARRLRELRPDADLWFSSYPSRGQATAHGTPWDALVDVSDYGLPQVYFSSQGARWDEIRTDHRGKPVVAVFSPGDWPSGWADLAHQAVATYGAVAIWRYPDSRHHASRLAELAAHATEEDDVTKEDLRAAVLDVLQSDEGQAAVFSAAWRGGQLPVSADDGAARWLPATMLANIRVNSRAAAVQSDPDALATAVAHKLGPVAGVTQHELRQALVAALTDLAAPNS